MNRNKLKGYAPKARRDFIRAVSDRAAKFGITAKRIEPMHEQGDSVVILGHAYPRTVAEQRNTLERAISLRGFEQVMEQVAYTWFNRFAAIRFMEVNGYLDHGYRVLSHPNGKALPEILEKADSVSLPGLNRQAVIDLKLDGTKDAELYRMLLIAQCNALHRAMPFLFEKIDDETELLLPDNLLHTDSLIRKLATSIDEADWQEIEIIGWFYQFYISEKKDQVIGKVVKSDDIPAATQLFTPNWIVKYMVQNSLGAQWLATYPDSSLKADMDYYIEPAEQTEKVQRQLAEITPKELNPEELTLMDPACGSGHILVEAYDLFKAIYLERGYRLRDIPRVILEKNLYGLDIDDRAAQMAGFALLMKARADDRHILSPDNPPLMHVMAIQDSKGLDAEQIARTLVPKGRFELVPSDDLLPDTVTQPILSAEEKSGVGAGTIRALIELFADAKTFGSLIAVSEEITGALPSLKVLVKHHQRDDLYQREAKECLETLIRQAKMLSRLYDATVTNPPYMGGKGLNPKLKSYAKLMFPTGKSDLFSMFIERSFGFTMHYRFTALITMEAWMFLSSFAKFRKLIFGRGTISSLIHMPYEGRSPTAMGISFGTAAFCIQRHGPRRTVGSFSRLRYFDLHSDGTPKKLDVFRTPQYQRAQAAFSAIPGTTIAFDASDRSISLFRSKPISSEFESGGRCKTSNDELFLRRLWEVKHDDIGVDKVWCLLSKGGEFRKWFGNVDTVMRWDNEAKKEYSSTGGLTRPEYWCRCGVTWTIVSSKGAYSFRLKDAGTQYNSVSPTIFGADIKAYRVVPGCPGSA